MTRIAIVGTQSTGKSTLVNKVLEEMPNINTVVEVARDCPYPLNEETNFKSQEWILREQIRREMQHPLNEITLCDRSVYDQAAYVFYAYSNENMTDEEAWILEELIVSWGYGYDALIYLPIEFELEKDGVRSESEEYRNAIDDIIKQVLQNYVTDERKFEVRGTLEERVEQVKKIIAKFS